MVYNNLFLSAYKAADGCYNCGSTAHECLLHCAVLAALHQFVNCNFALNGFHAPASCQLQNGFSGYAGQDGAVQLGCHQLAVPDEHQVHAAAFFYIFSFNAVNPYNLRIALLCRLFACSGCRCVVAAAFCIACAAANRTHIIHFNQHIHRSQTALVVAAYHAGNHHKCRMRDAMQCQICICTEQEGTQIQRCTILVGHPILFHLYEFSQIFHCILHIKLRQAQSFCGIVHTLEVFRRAEHLHLAAGCAVRLQPFKNLCAVMEYQCAGVQRNIPKGNDAGVLPAVFAVILHHKHVVCKCYAKGHGSRIGLHLGVCCFCYLYFHHTSSLLCFSHFIVLSFVRFISFLPPS